MIGELLFVQVPRFYAEVERANNSDFRNRPLIVGGNPRKRGLVQSATADALEGGVREGIPVFEALQLCPNARALLTDMPKYREAASRLRAHFRGSSSRVELAGLDCAYLEAAGAGDELAERLVERVGSDLGLPLRVGIAPIKFVARLAAEEIRDGEIQRIDSAKIVAFLSPMPAARLPGVGPKTEARLAEIEAYTIGDVAKVSQEVLYKLLGSHGRLIHQAARGLGEARLRAAPHARSFSQEMTLAGPELDLTVLQEILAGLAFRLSQSLNLERLCSRRVMLKICYSDLERTTRTRTLDEPVSTSSDIKRIADLLLERTEAGLRRIRMVGLGVYDLLRTVGEDQQLELFEGDDVHKAL